MLLLFLFHDFLQSLALQTVPQKGGTLFAASKSGEQHMSTRTNMIKMHIIYIHMLSTSTPLSASRVFEARRKATRRKNDSKEAMNSTSHVSLQNHKWNLLQTRALALSNDANRNNQRGENWLHNSCRLHTILMFSHVEILLEKCLATWHRARQRTKPNWFRHDRPRLGSLCANVIHPQVHLLHRCVHPHGFHHGLAYGNDVTQTGPHHLFLRLNPNALTMFEFRP